MHLVVRFAQSSKLDFNFDQVILPFHFLGFQYDKTINPLQAIKTRSSQLLQLLGVVDHIKYNFLLPSSHS